MINVAKESRKKKKAIPVPVNPLENAAESSAKVAFLQGTQAAILGMMAGLTPENAPRTLNVVSRLATSCRVGLRGMEDMPLEDIPAGPDANRESMGFSVLRDFTANLRTVLIPWQLANLLTAKATADANHLDDLSALLQVRIEAAQRHLQNAPPALPIDVAATANQIGAAVMGSTAPSKESIGEPLVNRDVAGDVEVQIEATLRDQAFEEG